MCSPQNLLRTRANAINAPDETVRGIDVSLSYLFDDVLGGSLRVGLDGTYYFEYSRDPFFIEGILVPTAGGRDFAGTRGGIQSLPDLRGSALVEYASSVHNVRLAGHYIDGVTDLQDTARDPDGTLDEATPNDARLAPLLFRIQSRLNDPVDLASMAQQFGASRFHFHRLFREAVDETPRQYVERLRLECALLRLARTNESILSICHAVGFQNHETFSRAFKRRYRFKPIEVRQFAQWQQAKRITIASQTTGYPCDLSEVRFESLQPGFLLAKRRVGEYSSFDYAPFTKSDRLWSPLARWAARHGVRHATTAWGLTYDIPGLTPPDAQRFDGCLRIDRAVSGSRDIQCLRFDGGDYAVIDHAGDVSTIVAAYAKLADVINLDLNRIAWREAPFVTIYHDGSDARPSKTTVCFPVVKLHSARNVKGSASSTR